MKLDMEKMAELLPTIRAELARELAISHKLSQKDISNLLGVSQPAVSQYLRDIRGKKRLSQEKEVKDLCEKIINGLQKQELEQEMYNLCRLAISQQ